jgi:hypothetical protein
MLLSNILFIYLLDRVPFGLKLLDNLEELFLPGAEVLQLALKLFEESGVFPVFVG